jgi:hypothetical protein
MSNTIPANAASNEIEGLDSVDNLGTLNDPLGEYPIDTLLIRNETRTVFDVVRRINNDGFIMDPDFQREFVWPVDKQSKLIESVVMRIPLPVFYLAENAQGKAIVVDGLQRLSTFRSFLAGDLKLQLPHRAGLDGCAFRDLAPKLQNRIEDCNLILYIIDCRVPERAKLDIFERVNSGEPLTRQQMRNCLYSGQATRWLKTEASTPEFVEATGASLNAKAMKDREFVNHFCAFTLLGVDDYRKDMDEFLAKSLALMNQQSAAELEVLSRRFRLGLQNNLYLFDRHAFRKHRLGQTNRSVLNASLWDVMSTGLSRIPHELVVERASEFRQRFYELLADRDFDHAITYGTSSVKNVTKRFKMGGQIFKEVFGDYAD